MRWNVHFLTVDHWHLPWATKRLSVQDENPLIAHTQCCIIIIIITGTNNVKHQIVNTHIFQHFSKSFHILSLILTTLKQNKCYYTHFREQQTERLSDLLKIRVDPPDPQASAFPTHHIASCSWLLSYASLSPLLSMRALGRKKLRANKFP